ncbi:MULTISPECIES: condensation domain-containing protein [unclassified Sinorhizobium]|uniref:condensation domain-containing protein n=1 Tax=unclassified Sinorhizobium TaxID=2613772 RepID=UPI003524F6F1
MDMPADRKEKLAAHYCALPASERRVLRQKLRALGISQSDLRIHKFEDEGTDFPLSPAQERLWFLWRLDPESPAYNIVGKVRLKGELDWQSLQVAATRLIERQESLRTRFREVDGVPFQTIETPPSVSWKLKDIADLEEPERSKRLDQILAEAAKAPFDLEHSVPLRLTAIRLGSRDQVLHFAMHHIISDAWSMPILMNEFAIFYNAARDGCDAGLPELHVRYRDYALWQREWLDREELEHQLSYWRERLGKEHPVLQLPLDGKRTNSVSDAAEQIGITVPSHVSAPLRHLARSSGTTPFVVLLSGLQLLLYRYTGQSDIRIGVPIAGRDRTETQDLIGFFVNTLVLRADVSGAMTLSKLLEQTRLRVLEAQRNQDVPFAQLVDELQPQRNLATTPLFQVMFNMHQKGRERVSLDGVTGVSQGGDSISAQFELVVDAIDRGETFDILFSYKTDLFAADTIGRMARKYLDILTQLGDAVGKATPVADIAWSDSGLPREPADHPFIPVTDRIGERALQHPAAEAVVCEGERLSYGELDALANRIARRLQSLGVQPDERVGLAVERSTGLVAALLGIMKAGAAYVPLDPAYPAERLAHMIKDSRITRVVTDAATKETLAGLLSGLDTVLVNEVGSESSEPFVTSIHPDQLAYVIYTSGSTGVPKGVGISHRALSLHIDDFLGSFGISAADTPAVAGEGDLLAHPDRLLAAVAAQPAERA